MIRARACATALGLVFLPAAPALAVEGGPIRTGEHADFSRIVLRIEPTTEWSLESGPGKATIFFPGKALDFPTDGIFELMPRTRVLGIETGADAEGTTVSVALGCDCRVSASFVDARYLAIDIGDRAAPGAVVPETASEAARAPDAASDPGLGEAPTETPEDRDARETAAIATAEEILIRQIERAASQGLIELAGPDPAKAAADHPDALRAAEVLPPQAPAAPQASEALRLPMGGDGEDEAEPIAPGKGLLGLLDHEQIQATTVFDRYGRRAMTAAVVPPIAPGCLADERFDVALWSTPETIQAQLPALRRHLIGEFDKVDPEAVADLARLYARFGFGAEAQTLLASFAADAPVDPLLVDIAHVVDGLPAPADGPLSLEAACPGRHGLWQALGGGVPAYRSADNFAASQVAFAELPPDLRALLGPSFVSRLLDAARPDEARLIYDTMARPGIAPPQPMRLAQARLVAAEGHPGEGAAAMRALVEENAPNAVEALVHLARLTIDADLPIPDSLVTDLDTAAAEHRRSPREVELRALLAETLAHLNLLRPAVEAIEAAQADLPEARGQFARLAAKILAQAEPVKVGPSTYAEIIVTRAGLIGAEPRDDAARRTIGANLIDLGLPEQALAVLAPAQRRGDTAARLLAARAHIRLGNSAAARGMLAGIESPEASALLAQAHALAGDYGEAVSVLTQDGLAGEAAPYAWPSGDWTLAGSLAESGDRVAMASFMATQEGTAAAPAPSQDPSALNGPQAFQEPIPSLEDPSLGAARRLLAASKQVGGFVETLLQEQ